MSVIKRLNPTAETLKKILAKSGNQCFFPDCTAEIYNDNYQLIAQCCHIEAAMPGGKRFNPNQSEEDRRSIENLLFLCYKHHAEIDSDDTYTTEYLKEIKQNHENKFCQNPLSINDNIVQEVLLSLNHTLSSIKETTDTVKSIDKKQDDILKILRNQSISQFPVTHFLKSAISVDNYIQRKLSLENQFDIFIFSFQELLTHSQKKPLKALIIADGGEGKTVYLSQLAKDSIKSNCYPVFVNLKDYLTSQSLQSYVEDLHPELKDIANSDYNFMSFFLDGFDEIGDTNGAVKQIRHFCNSHPETNIILSSRRNIYANDFPQFQTYFLADISLQEIKEYIKRIDSENINCDDFVKQVYFNGFSNILHNPFYLNILIESYVENDYSLQNISRKMLINNLLDKRADLDKKHRPDLRLDSPIRKAKINSLGKKMGICMALMSKRSLSEKEITSILKEEEFELSIQSLPIKKGNIVASTQYWEFEHNIFLEHFASLALEELPFDKVIEYTTSSNKVKFEWSAIIAHLIGILDKKDNLFQSLTKWVYENDLEIFSKIEKEQIDLNTREDIFQKIFTWYKEKSIWLDSYKIKNQEFASFGESRNNVFYILNEICNPDNDRYTKINAALIFKEFSLNDIQIEERKQIVEEYLKSIKSIDQKQGDLLYYLISAFPSKEIEQIDDLVSTFRDSNHVQIRVSLFHLISDLEMVDRYISLFLEGYSKGDRLPDGALYGSYYDTIDQALLKIKEPKSFALYFNYLTEKHHLEYAIQHKPTILNTVINNSICHCDDLIFESMYKLFNHYVSHHFEKQDLPISFFDKTNTREKSFLKSLQNICDAEDKEKHIHVSVILALLKDDFLPILFNWDLDEGCLQSIYYNLERNSNLALKIKRHLEEKYNFIELERPDWSNIWAQRRREDFDILFDKEWFYKECLAAFNRYNTDTIEKEQLYDRNSDEKSVYVNHSVRSFLFRFKKNKTISKIDITTWFAKNPDGLDRFLMEKIYEILSSRRDTDDLGLSENQKQYIINWYNKFLDEVDFTKAVDFNKLEVNDLRAYYLFFYMQKLNLACSDSVLCDMLYLPSMHPFSIDLKFITSKIQDKDKLNKAVIQILKDCYTIPHYNHELYQLIDYVIEDKIVEAYPVLIQMLRDFKRDANEYVKFHIIHNWIKNGLDEQPLILSIPDLSQSLQLSACRYLSNEREITSTKPYVENIINNPENEKIWLTAISVLISMRDIKGLQLGIDWWKKQNDLNYTLNELHTSNMFPCNLLLRYEDLSSLPFLFQLLKLSFQIKEPYSYDTIKRACIDNICNIGERSEKNIEIVTQTFEKFISDNKQTEKNITFLNYYIEDMKRKFWNKSYHPYDFNEVKQICKEIFEG